MPWPRPPIRKNPPSHKYQRGMPDQRVSPVSPSAAGLFKDISGLVQSSVAPSSLFSVPSPAIPVEATHNRSIAMNLSQTTRKTAPRRVAALVLVTVAAASLTACGSAIKMVFGTGAKPPAIAEFGLGPRSSAHGHYVATLTPDRALRPRQTQ